MRVVPVEEAQFLYAISPIGLLTGSVGILSGFPFLGSGVCIGACIARAYWSNPHYGFLRRLDMAWIQLLIWTHLWAALGSPVQTPYLVIQALGAGAYGISWIFLKQGKTWESTYAHAAVHLCSHMSLFLLYLHFLIS